MSSANAGKKSNLAPNDMAKNNIKLKTLVTAKMQSETEQQYTAWLLYCETGSIGKLIRLWDGVGQNLDESWMVLAKKLGKRPSHTTIGNWSKKYRWVERCELKLTEDIESIRKKTQEIKQKKIGLIAEIFWDKLQALRRQIKKGEGATVDEIKKLWEMFRTEMGEAIGRHDINFIDESKQKPLTPEEDEFRKEIDKTIKMLHERRRKSRKSQHSLLD
jgi:hypothetical protein